MRNLTSYVQSWWHWDLRDDILDDDAYDRFINRMNGPKVVKPRNWILFFKIFFFF